MSVESTTLERSALERKARDELTTIARDLGVKTRARDRKADIVQAILASRVTEGDGGRDGRRPHDVPNQRDEGGAVVSQPQDDPPGAGGTPSAQDLPAKGTDMVDVTSSETSAPPAASTAPAEAKQNGTGDVAAPAEAKQDSGDTSAKPDKQDDKQPSGSQPQDKQSDQPSGEKSDGDRSDNDKSDKPADKQGSEKQDDKQSSDKQGGGDKPQNKGQGQQNRQRDQRNDQRDQRNGQRDQRGSGGGGNGGGGGGQDESGNRRRRRRGRNRNEAGGSGGGQPEEFTGEPVEVSGYLDLRDEGYGFLRVKGTRPSKEDIYVSVKQARQFGLRKGDHIKGGSRPAQRNEKNPALLRIDAVNGGDPDKARSRRKFGDLTPLFPDEKLRLETSDDPGEMTARIIDLISPIGKGQRGLIVSPPKAGKTTIIKQIVRSIEMNNPEVKLLVLQVDERPEEVTDMRRWLRNSDSEVAASTFDRPAEEHAHVAELTIERAKRMVEDGRDVCIVLDGITRLARAYNLAAPATGRIMSGGVDSGALYPPKKFFGAARNVEEGGSLTILATALVETGSKMDEVIFEEFKGTGNMELRLDRRLSERRIYPAIDVDSSSTRHEELLFPRNQLNLVWALRRVLSGLSSSDGGNAAALELLIDRMKTFRTNDEFLAEVAKNRLAASG